MALCLPRITLRRCQQARQISTTLTAEPPTTPFPPRILQDFHRNRIQSEAKSLKLAYEDISLGPRLDSAYPIASYSLRSSQTSLEPVYNNISRVNRFYPQAEHTKDLTEGYNAFTGRYWKLLPALTALGLSDMHHTIHALLHAGQQKELWTSDVIASQDIMRRLVIRVLFLSAKIMFLCSIMHGQADFLVTYLDGKMFLHPPEDARYLMFILPLCSFPLINSYQEIPLQHIHLHLVSLHTSSFSALFSQGLFRLFGLPRAYSGRPKDQMHTLDLSKIVVKRSIGGLRVLLVDRVDCLTGTSVQLSRARLNSQFASAPYQVDDDRSKMVAKSRKAGADLS